MILSWVAVVQFRQQGMQSVVAKLVDLHDERLDLPR